MSRHDLPRWGWLLALCAALVPAGRALSLERGDGPAALVERLGDESYATRRSAAEQLTTLGLGAREALVAGLKHADPEVRRRCGVILTDAYHADFRKRLDAFRADRQGKRDHGLPGWQRYGALIGDDPKARELFVKMLKAEGVLMASAAAGGRAAGENVALRLRQLYQSMLIPDPQEQQLPPLATVAALLFVTSDPRLPLPQALLDDPNLLGLSQQPEFMQTLLEGEYRPYARKLLGQWVLRPASPDILFARLNVAVQYDIPEGLVPALQIVREKNDGLAHYRGFAAAAVGKLGGKRYATALAEMLDDRTEIGQAIVDNNKRITTEVCDVALAWLVHLTGQDHAAYGQAAVKADFEEIRKNAAYTGNINLYGFADKAKREKALKKWQAYAAEHPLPPLPLDQVIPLRIGRAIGWALSQVSFPEMADVLRMLLPPAAAADSPAPKPPNPDDDTEEPLRPTGVTVPPADREQVRALALARDLCRHGHYDHAVRLLDGVLTTATDAVFTAEGHAALVRSVQCEAERLVGELPPEGRRAYQLRCAARAERALKEAVAAGNREALASVAARFFYTPAGAEALYLVASHYADRGEAWRAALCLERIRARSPEADRFEPALTLRLATCWAEAGIWRAAEDALRDLRARRPRISVRVAGQERDLFARPEQALAWLESVVGRRPPSAPELAWPLRGGGPTRNVVAAAGIPFADATSLRPTSDDAGLLRALGRLRKGQAEEYRPALPALHPLVLGDTVVLRTATHLAAVDLDGRLRWDAALDDSLPHFLKTADADDRQQQAAAFERGLQRRLWEDLTFGTLSSDGRLIFGVEGLVFGLRADYQCPLLGPDGQPRLDPGPLRTFNRLCAYNARTGKLQWEIDGSPAAAIDKQELAPGREARRVRRDSMPGSAQDNVPWGTFFLGPPLPLGDRLYAVAEVEDDETRLLEIEAATGRVLHSFALSVRDSLRGALGDPDLAPAWIIDGPQRRRGATPAYADGVLVCPTGENEFVAVDLATRSVRWAYQTPSEATVSDDPSTILLQRRLLEGMEGGAPQGWLDIGAVLAEGRVLLTPPDGDELICLGLSDGRWLWSAPRRDGLFLGGVADGRVVVVGRGGARCLSLADGTPAWSPERLSWPDGALPSGRGLLSQGRYYAPLSTGEVAAVDLRQGCLVARSRGPAGHAPGNLVPCGETVLWQNAEGLWRCDTVAARERRLAAALRERPGDPELLAAQGELRLCGGRPAEAMALLRQALTLKPDARTRAMLVAAIIDGLRAAFDKFQPPAQEVLATLNQDELWWQLQCELALGWQRTGHSSEAFAAYLKLVDAQVGPGAMQRVETARAVRRDRWLMARLAELRASASAAEAAAMDREISARLQQCADAAAESAAHLPAALTYFGFHPAAHAARLRLASQLPAKGKKPWLAPEQLLWRVFRGGSPAEQREAAARLAALLRAAKETEEAARFYAYLADQWPDAVCLDGQTGRQIAAALPANDPVRRRLDRPGVWPAGKVQVQTSGQTFDVSDDLPVAMLADSGPLGNLLSVQYGAEQRKLTACDRLGVRKWSLVTKKAETEGSNAFMEFPARWLGRAQGRLLVAWLGDMVCAVDCFPGTPHLLWKHDTVKVDPRLVEMGVCVPAQGPTAPAAHPGGEPLPLAVTAGCVCFLAGHKVLAVEPFTGEVLWMRDDAQTAVDLFGDDDVLLLTPRDSNEAVVLSTHDGRELGCRRVPELSSRLATHGRRVLTWQADDRRTRLALVDPWAGRTLWHREFDRHARPWVVEGDEVAVLDRSGRLVLLTLNSGAEVLQAQLDPLPALEQIAVFRSSQHYVVVAGRAAEAPLAGVQTLPGDLQVNGRVYGFDRPTGKLLWSLDVADQALRPDGPADLPLLVFLTTGQKMVGDDVRCYSKLLCVDKRNGRVLHKHEVDDNRGVMYEVHGDPAKARIDLRTALGTVKFTFNAP